MSKEKNGVEHFSTQEPVLLSEAVQDKLKINYEEFKFLIKLGAIYVNNFRQVKDKWILAASEFRVHTKPRRFKCDYPWRDLILFQNEAFLILNKPSGVPSHPSVDNVIEDALTQTSLALKMPLYVTHRLDTLTSGLIVYAKKKQFVKSFNIQMLERAVIKKYVAFVETVENLPRELVHYMDPTPGTPKRLSASFINGWDECRLEILEQKKISPSSSRVKINLLTGRTHQIRAQLSFLNAPIIGDALYGAKCSFTEQAIALKSCYLEFDFEGLKMKFNLEDFTV